MTPAERLKAAHLTREETMKYPYENEAVSIPREVAVCPYCDASLYVNVTGWEETQENEHGWRVELMDMDCESEPPIDSDEWPAWLGQHTRMPYVYRMPVEIKVMDWLNKRLKPAPVVGLDVPDPNTINLFD